MTNNEPEMPSPEVCASTIFEISGTKFEPATAADLWPKILQHKWLMSEKLHRDVGLKTAGTDFLENMEQALKKDYLVTTDTFSRITPKIRLSLADVAIEEFQKDTITYSRT